MSLKYLIYGFVLLINMLLMSCGTNSNTNTSKQTYTYYITSQEHLGIEKGDSVFTLNYAVGIVSDITTTKKTIIYQLQLSQEEVLFLDSEILLSDNKIHVDNKLSTMPAIILGDTLFYPSASQTLLETARKNRNIAR